jgi:PEGA domain
LDRLSVHVPRRVIAACALAGLAALAIPGVPAARAQGRGGDPGGEPVIVVDLRAAGTAEREGTRYQLEEALSRDPRLRLAPLDPGLTAVLRGPAEVAERGPLASFQAEIDRADALRADGDCKGALDAADAAIVGLAAEQAASAAPDSVTGATGATGAPGAATGATGATLGRAVTQSLEAAYGHALACAHDLGDTGRALVMAQRLRALGRTGAEPPPGVSPELWRAYPAVDALGNNAIVELAITTEPAGAQVWLDHRPVGPAPVTVLVGEGAHLVAAAGEGRAASQRVQVSQAALPRVAWGQSQVMVVHLPLLPRAWAWHTEAAEVARWRSTGTVDGAALGALLARLDVRFALVLVDADARLLRSGAPSAQAAQIWAVVGTEPGDGLAQRVGTGQLARPGAIAARVAARAAARDGASGSAVGASGGTSGGTSGQAGLDPGTPLLREGDVPRRFGSRPGEQRVARKPWWAYATIIGAVAATSLLILAADLGDDRQRIELRWP